MMKDRAIRHHRAAEQRDRYVVQSILDFDALTVAEFHQFGVTLVPFRT